MNKELILKTKDHLLEILDWSNDGNRKLAVQCIGEIVEEALQDLNEELKNVEQQSSPEVSDDCSHCCSPGEEKE